MIDTKQSFRRGKVIVEVHVDTSTAPCQHCNEMEVHLDTCIMRCIREQVVHTEITKVKVVYPSINAAKRANRLAKYRVIKTKVSKVQS